MSRQDVTQASSAAYALEILAALVGFDTVSCNSNLALIDWVERYLSTHGITCRRFPDETGQKAALFATIGPAQMPGYVLSGHTDVVPVDGQHWSSDPFTLRIANGRAYGRGAVDMKGYLACCLALVPQMVSAKLTRPIHLAFSYDEEVGCVGVRPMLRWLNEQPVKPLGAFIGEPSSMQVIIGHKGKRSARLVVTGTGAHSSLAPQAVNAVQFGARIVARIADIAARLEREGPRDALYDITHSTGHVGMMHGGEALNIVPERCEMVFEFRTIAQDDPDALMDQVRAYAMSELLPQMQRIDPCAGIEMEVYAGFSGLDTQPDAAIVSLAKHLSGRNDHAKVAYGTEAGLFTAIAGIPAVVLGPGSISQAHKPDEYIEIAELEKCLATLGRLVDHCSQ
ncbi:MAG: acetylornithine deacetylase [Bosea sp. (in: a-proteobacteria)]